MLILFRLNKYLTYLQIISLSKADIFLSLQRKGMPSKWVFIILNLIVCVIASEEDEATRAYIKITEFDYEDTCLSTAEAQWEFINSPSNEKLSAWVCFAIYKHGMYIDKYAKIY